MLLKQSWLHKGKAASPGMEVLGGFADVVVVAWVLASLDEEVEDFELTVVVWSIVVAMVDEKEVLDEEALNEELVDEEPVFGVVQFPNGGWLQRHVNHFVPP
jgi:hypothetical protein